MRKAWAAGATDGLPSSPLSPLLPAGTNLLVSRIPAVSPYPAVSPIPVLSPNLPCPLSRSCPPSLLSRAPGAGPARSGAPCGRAVPWRAAALRPRGGGGAAVLTAAAAPGAAPGSRLAAPGLPRFPPRYGLHGEAAGREGAAGRHGAADSADRGEPEPALPHGERRRPAGRPGRGGRRERAEGARRNRGTRGAGRGGFEA